MKIILPKEFERLPEWQLRMAMLHARSYVEDTLGIVEGAADYDRKIQKEAIKYLRQGIDESLTPHMDDGKNPTTPIAEDVFNLSPVFALDGIFFKRLEDSSKREQYQRQVRAAINTIAGVYAVSALRLRKADYAIPAGASKEQKRFTRVNQYKRVFLVDAITALLESIFRVNPAAMDKFLEEGFAGKNLDDPKIREEFIVRLRKQIVEEGFNAESLKKIF